MTGVRPARSIDGPDVFAQQFNVSRETVEKLNTYASLLKQWQKTINLVSPATLDAVWHRHMADSAQLVSLAAAGALTWVDLGSGAGFPGLVLAILMRERPGLRVTLVESDARKVAFLREVVRQTALASAVDICHARIEIASTHTRVGEADIITARALAPLSKLLGLCQPFFGPNTVALLLKGRDGEREADEARADWQFEANWAPSVTDVEGRIAVITKLQAHIR